MPEINQQELKRQIKENDLSFVYFLYGNDTYLKQNYTEKIANKVVGKGQELSVQRYSGDSLPLNELSDAVLTTTFFGGGKCVIITDYNADSANKENTKALVEILKEAHEGCVVIFRYSALEVNTKSSAKFRALIKEIDKIGCTVKLDHPDSAALIKILSAAATKRGSSLGAGAARYLITRCGDDLQTLISETDKLSAFAAGTEITNEMIDEICVESIDVSIFALAKALQAGNIDGALSILDKLYEQRIDPVVILSTLSGAYIDMYRAKIIAAAGMRTTDVAKDFGYYGTEFRLKNAAPLASKISTAALRRSLQELAGADGRLKSSRVEKRIIIEETMVKLLILAKQT